MRSRQLKRKLRIKNKQLTIEDWKKDLLSVREDLPTRTGKRLTRKEVITREVEVTVSISPTVKRRKRIRITED